MKIQRHRNGTFSITEMTGADLDNFVMAACTATAFYVRPDAGEWDDRNRQVFQRLDTQLRRVQATQSTLTLDLVSADSHGLGVNSPDSMGRRSYEQRV